MLCRYDLVIVLFSFILKKNYTIESIQDIFSSQRYTPKWSSFNPGKLCRFHLVQENSISMETSRD